MFPSKTPVSSRLFWIILLFATLLLLPSIGFAEEACSDLSPADKKDYLEYGDQAAEHWGNKDYVAAIRSMVDAMSICDDDPRIQYNLARAYHKAEDCNRALFWYEQILSIKSNTEIGQSIGRERQRSARYIAELEVQCSASSRITIDCSDKDIRLSIGDTIREASCPYSGRIDSGTYKLRAELNGHEPYVVSMQLVAGENNRVLVPALDLLRPDGPSKTTGTLRITCEEGLERVNIHNGSQVSEVVCDSKHTLAPGSYALSIPDSKIRENFEIVIGETLSIKMKKPKIVIAKGSGFFLGVRLGPMMGLGSGKLYHDEDLKEYGQDLDGLQPSLPVTSILVEFGYYAFDSVAFVGQFHANVTNHSRTAIIVTRWRPWSSEVVDLFFDLGAGYGYLFLPVELENGDIPLSRTGPFFVKNAVGLAFHITHLLSLVTTLEVRSSLPEVGFPIDLGLGIQVEF